MNHYKTLTSDEMVSPVHFVEAAMAWHFAPETGSTFWLNRADTLGFDPIRDIHTFDDLARFPNVTDEFRGLPIEELIPRGFGKEVSIEAVIESGGTTGEPKRLPLLSEFAERMARAEVAWLEQIGVPRSGGWLAVFPSGPHGALGQMRRVARKYSGSIPVFAVDMDPRWVKARAEAGDKAGVEAYADHVIRQATSALETQNLIMLRITPPLLARIVRDDHLVSLIREKIRFIIWGGAHLDADSRYYYRTELFPNAQILGRYGTTMALGGGCVERPGLAPDDVAVMDATLAPHVTVRISDFESGQAVGVGERGQIVVSLLSANFLLPNNAERDTAVRAPGSLDSVGHAIADVAPMAIFAGTSVVEGVY